MAEWLKRAVTAEVMSVFTAKVAGVPRVITCAPPFEGRPGRRL